MKRANTKTRDFDLSRHDLGKIGARELKREAQIASLNLAKAEAEREAGNYSTALNLYFRCAAIGVNVLCTAKIHKIRISKKELEKMQHEVETSTEGVRETMMEGAGLSGNAKEGLEKARIQLRNAESARVKGDLRLAVSRALTAAVTAARASRSRAADAIVQSARIIIQDAAIQRLLRRRA